MKIYTKTGDKGETRLVDGTLVSKFNARVEAYGTVDELNSYLGLIASLPHQPPQSTEIQTIKIQSYESELKIFLTAIQNNLFIIGSLLATDDLDVQKKLPQLADSETHQLEIEIDRMTDQLQELKNFILPTGTLRASHFHVARTICRRAERRAVEALQNKIMSESLIIYLNRLSDYLFTAARFENHMHNIQDTIWTKN